MTSRCLRRAPKQQRSRDRLDLILDHASVLLAELGPSGTTITAVAERTGLPTSSVYDYVESDRTLIGAVAERGLEATHLALVEVIGSPATFEELSVSLGAALRMFLGRFEAEDGFREALAFIDADPLLMQINLDDTRRNAAAVAEVIAGAGISVDVDTAIFMFTHLSGALAGLVARVDDEEAADLIAQYEKMVTLFLASVSMAP